MRRPHHGGDRGRPAAPGTQATSRDSDHDPEPTPEELARLQYELEPLMHLVARVHERRPDPPAYRDERFLMLLARECELEADEDDLWTRAEATEVAREIRARLRAAAVPVRRVDRRVKTRQPVFFASLEVVVEGAGVHGCAPYIDLAAAAGAGRELWEEACEQWVVLPPGVARGRYLALGVAGDSMEPLLHAGDVILVRLGPDVARDALVVARVPDGGYVVKQAGRVAPADIELLSLNESYAPLTIPRAADAVLGTVVLRWCAHERKTGEAAGRRTG